MELIIIIRNNYCEVIHIIKTTLDLNIIVHVRLHCKLLVDKINCFSGCREYELT